jgi:hypothetical protein
MEKQGVASAVNDTSREVGSAFGIAIIGAALNSAYKSSIHNHIQQFPEASQKKIESGVAFTQFKAPAGLEAQWSELATAGKEAFLKGVHTSLLIATFASLFGAIIVGIFAPSLKDEREQKVS